MHVTLPGLALWLSGEYEAEYRLVSVTCSSSQLGALRVPERCRHFQCLASTCTRRLKTFNPKVVGSIPTRPISELPAIAVFLAA